MDFCAQFRSCIDELRSDQAGAIRRHVQYKLAAPGTKRRPESVQEGSHRDIALPAQHSPACASTWTGLCQDIDRRGKCIEFA
eukprot:2745265-Rhodomonas_salina.4